ncbi:TAXI family TRAP transporter solute-binding subunit [Chloroflexota bacterium]
MTNNKFRFVVVGLVTMLLVMSILLGCTQTPEPAKQGQPEIIKVGGYDLGTSGYISAAATGEGIMKQFNIKQRYIPYASGLARMLAAKTGAVDCTAQASDTTFAIEGLFDFGNIEWGPQPLRIVYWAKRFTPFSLVTQADSGIKTFADLKGKRIAWLAGSSSPNASVTGSLAFGGLTWDDVEKVEFQGWTACWGALLDGSIDACMGTGTSSAMQQQQASPSGLYWIPMPPEDTEGWKRYRQHHPLGYPMQATIGAGISEANPISLTCFPFPMYVTYEDQASDDTAYWITKALVESYDFYKDATPDMPGFKLEAVMEQPVLFPWHDGSIKYLKEIGVWTDRHERNQKALVERQEKLRALWDAVMIEFAGTGLKSNEFQNYWLERRAEAFPSFHEAMD